jgi:hypothetical protein
MRHTLTFACLLICACVVLNGCGDSGYTLSKQDLVAFKDAAPEMKQAWENGLKADKANDYLTASTNYRSLLGKSLTPDQLVAVQTALGGLNVRMNEAATRGDSAAKKAIDAAKDGGSRR